jgi:hypothetical protein
VIFGFPPLPMLTTPFPWSLAIAPHNARFFILRRRFMPSMPDIGSEEKKISGGKL